MIKNTQPLSMAEVAQLIAQTKEENQELVGFINKFIKLKPKEAEELRKKIEDLSFIKVKPEHIVKIIDLLPEDTADLNKIFTDVGLDENETNKILEIVKQYK